MRYSAATADDRRGGVWRVMFRERSLFDEPKIYWKTVVAFLFHVAGTAIMWCAIAGIAWTIEVFIGWLQDAHKFGDYSWAFISSVPPVILVFDTLFSGIVFIGGMYRFLKDLLSRGRENAF